MSKAPEQNERKCTHELTVLAVVLDRDDRLASSVDDGEGPVLHVLLEFGLVELATDQALCVEYGVLRVGGECVLGGVTNTRVNVSTDNRAA